MRFLLTCLVMLGYTARAQWEWSDKGAMSRLIPQTSSASVTGDPIAAAINADGKSASITFKGMATGGTYLYDNSGSDETLGLTEPSTAKMVFTAVSRGYDTSAAATTTTRTVYGTRSLRVAGTTGKDETTSGSDVVINFALSEPVYVKDKAGGGNSGTDPTLITLAGIYTKSGVPSNAKTLTVVNNSTLTNIAPRGQWGTIDRQKAMTDFVLEFDPQYVHGVVGIACVVFTCTGQTSLHVESATVTSRTARQRAGTSLYSDAYTATITLSGFTQGEDIACRVRVYPAIGDLIFDSDNQSSDYLVQHDNTLTLKCDKTAALEVFGIVDTRGNDSTGVASATIATARANPFATIDKALSIGAAMVYIKNQSHTYDTAGSPSALGYWRTVTEDPTDTGGTVQIHTAFVFLNTDYLKFKSVRLKLLGALSIFNGSSGSMFFESCAFNANGFTLAANICDDVKAAVFVNCTIDPLDFALQAFGANIIRQSFDGCDFGTPASACEVASAWRYVACKGVKVSPTVTYSATASPTAHRVNVLVKNNRFLNVGLKSDFDSSLDDAVTDYFFVGNEIEGLTAVLTGSPVFEFGAGASAEYDKDRVVIAHNTIVGERQNHLYNSGEGGNSAAKYRRYVSVVGNIFGDQETKHDLFTGNGGADANRIGGWWYDWGTSAYGNFARLSDFPPDYRGIGSIQETNNPLFTDDRSGSATGGNSYNYNANSGTGGGTYTIGGGSPLLNRIPANKRHAAFTLRGTAIPNDGTAAAGANQL